VNSMGTGSSRREPSEFHRQAAEPFRPKRRTHYPNSDLEQVSLPERGMLRDLFKTSDAPLSAGRQADLVQRHGIDHSAADLGTVGGYLE
jgi:hypothetical protein